MVQPILSFKKILTKKQYGSTHIVFYENLDQKTIWFNLIVLLENFDLKTLWFSLRCHFRKVRPKDNTV